MQYVHFLQRKYSLGSFNLLGHTAPAQAASLLLIGPFLDYWLTTKRVDAYDYNMWSLVSTAAIYGLSSMILIWSDCFLLIKKKKVIVFFIIIICKLKFHVLNYPDIGITNISDMYCHLLFIQSIKKFLNWFPQLWEELKKVTVHGIQMEH